MTTLNDVKAFFAENTENTDVQDYIKTFVSDDRMLELALNSENGKQFFNKEFDRKISESRKKMEANYEAKYAEKLAAAENEWVDKHKKKDTKSPVELKLEEMQKQHDALQAELKRKDLMSIVNPNIPESFRGYADQLVDSNWSQEDAKAFVESFNANIESHITAEVEKLIASNKTNPGNPRGNQSNKTDYSKMEAEQIAKLPDAEYKAAMEQFKNQ